MAVFIIILFAGLVLIGGIAVDMSQLNAQKSYAQGQADLAAQSAAGYLHDLDEARRVARETVRRNDQYGKLPTQDIQIVFGTFTPVDGFEELPEDGDGAGVNAVDVKVEMPWRLLLWSSILSGEDYMISRSAVGSAGPPFAAFTLRNRLLSVDTSESPLLDPLLGSLMGDGGLGLDLVGYDGLAGANIALHDLLGIASLDVPLDAVTFEEVLDATVTVQDLLTLMSDNGAFPSGALGGAGIPDASLQLGQLLQFPAHLLQANVGDVLPNLDVSAFDLLLVTAGLAGHDPTERLSASVGVALPPLADIEVDTGLIRAPVTFAGPVTDETPLYGSISQIDVGLRASVLNLLSVGVTLSAADAEATLTSLNCSASEPDDVYATFTVTTGAASLGIDLALLEPIDEDDAEQPTTTVPIAAHTQEIEITKAQYDSGAPVPVDGFIELGSVTAALSTTLEDMREDLREDRDETEEERYDRCRRILLGLGCLLDAVVQLLDEVIGQLTSVIDGLTGLLANSFLLNGVVQALLDLLGIDVARAEIILNDVDCTPPGSVKLVN